MGVESHTPLGRTHLYAGILLTPWFLLYGLSAITLNHGGWFEQYRKHEAPWTKVSERTYRMAPIKIGRAHV